MLQGHLVYQFQSKVSAMDRTIGCNFFFLSIIGACMSRRYGGCYAKGVWTASDGNMRANSICKCNCSFTRSARLFLCVWMGVIG